MGGAGSIWCSSGMIISPSRNFWRDEKISEWNWSKKWAWMSTKRMAWNFAYFSCPWILDNILVSPFSKTKPDEGAYNFFHVGIDHATFSPRMGGCFWMVWIHSRHLEDTITATPKKIPALAGCSKPGPLQGHDILWNLFFAHRGQCWEMSWDREQFFFFPGASWMADDVFGEIRILGSWEKLLHAPQPFHFPDL